MKNKMTNKNYQPKYNTTAHKMIETDDELKNSIGFQTLDRLIDNSKKYIPKKDNYKKKELEDIFQKIASEIQSQIPEIQNNSYMTSLIYLAIGEENNLMGYTGPKNQNHILDESFKGEWEIQ